MQNQDANNALAQASRVILGIDPGTMFMGYGVLSVTNGKATYIDMGILDIKAEKDTYMKLKRIYDFTTRLIDKFMPDELAIEAQFFGKNVQSMLKLGRAQGVAIVAAMERDVVITEYAPLKIKQSITGNGMATKEEVWQMLRAQLGLNRTLTPDHLDATDALAAAFCHFNETKKSKLPKKYSGWEDFEAKQKRTSPKPRTSLPTPSTSSLPSPSRPTKLNGWADFEDKLKKKKQ